MSEGEAAAAPVLEAAEARIAVDGVTTLDRLTLTTRGDHVLVAGDTRALMAAITGVPLADPRGEGDDEGWVPGEAAVVAGTLALAGKSVGEGAHLGVMGAAPLDPPLPEKWTAEEWVAAGVRLAGLGRGPARELAAAALTRLGLGPARGKKLAVLSLAERRVLALAQAIALGPEVLVADGPLAGLEGPAADYVMRALLAAVEGRRALISAARLDAGSPEGALARGAHHLVVIAGAELVVEGPPAELFAASRVLALTVRGDPEPLRAELASRGIELRGGPTRFAASLPEGAAPRDILVAAAAVRTAVLEIAPVLG